MRFAIAQVRAQASESLLVAMVAGGVAAFIPAFLLFLATTLLGALLGWPPNDGEFPSIDSQYVLTVLVLAPIIETFILSLFLIVVNRFIPRPSLVCLLTAAIATYLHLDTAGLYGALSIAWVFYVFSALFLHWWKQSYWKAWLAAAVPHYLLNLWVLCLNTLLLSQIG